MSERTFRPEFIQERFGLFEHVVLKFLGAE
jgi:hypothetical protein